MGKLKMAKASEILSLFEIGQIMSFTHGRCPHCEARYEVSRPLDRMWNGEYWILRDSYEGGVLSANLANEHQKEPA